MVDDEVVFTPQHLDAMLAWLQSHRDNFNTIEDVISEVEYRRANVSSEAAA